MTSSSPNLTEDNIRQLQIARFNYRTISRAARTARFDGCVMIFLGMLTLCFGYNDPFSLAVGSVLATIGGIEIFGANRINQLNPGAAKLLAINQLILCVLVIVYCLLEIHLIRSGQIAKDVSAQYPSLGGLIDVSSANDMMVTLYEVIAGVSIFYMGGFALYYATRAKHIEEYRSQTPGWILDLQKSGVRV